MGIRRTSDSGRAVVLPTVGGDRLQQHLKEIVMNPIGHIRRVAGVLAGVACAWLGLAAAAPAAFAVRYPPPGRPAVITAPPEPPGWNKHPPLPPGHIHQPVHLAPVRVPVHTVLIGGTPGWQIAVIAIGAALFAATAAVLACRAWTARRKPITAAAEPSAAGADTRLLSAP
jgi:hypothetical protein